MVNPVGRIFAEADRAYLAGLFDGDGAIMASIEPHKEKKFGFRVRVIVKVTQKDPKILNWIYDTFSIGKVVSNRTTYDWIIKNQTDVLFLLEQIQLFLKGKDRQAKLAIQILQSTISSKENLIEVARLADTLASFNVRSKNRRKNFVSKIQVNIPPND